ncbi:MAG TPA: AraC family transcriptional regulator [Candidatus Eisenbergiella pullistercoris]|uniref:AraC family transcriptional regulator n=1 Tax=Candidatus Eisenbergiella pullistercoris TaxID=2838555 RepID=A0A9D1YQ02_9FIRM|nr:AraC family transcriptional regulator [Candidatus Eisenbergiella pullistercoris]
MVWVAHPVKPQIQLPAFYSLFEVHYDRGYEFPGESHNFWECLYVKEGEVCVSGDERVYDLGRGSIIFHKPLELHKFIVTGERGADLFIFSFSAEGPLTGWLSEKVFALTQFQQELLWKLYALARQSAGTGGDTGSGGAARAGHNTGTGGAAGSGGGVRTSGKAGGYYRYLDPFDRLPAYSQTVASFLELFMLSLAETGSVSSVSSDPEAILFSRAVNYLNSNIHRQPSVPETARFCGVSESGLKRLFDKYAGISVHKYLLKLKIKAAVQLLESGQTVSRTAQELGFNTQSYFSRAFKRETGLSPSQVQDGK